VSFKSDAMRQVPLQFLGVSAADHDTVDDKRFHHRGGGF